MTTPHQSIHGDNGSILVGVASRAFNEVHASVSFVHAQRHEPFTVCERLVIRTELFRKGEYHVDLGKAKD